MSLMTIVFRMLNKAGNAFIEPRREDGHGSAENNRSFVDTGLQQPTRPTDTQSVAGVVSLDAASIAALQQVVAAIANFPASYPLPGSQVTALTPQTDALTNQQLRATAVPVSTGLNQPTTPLDTQPVSAITLPLPAGAASAGKQLPDGHNVTVSNASIPLPSEQLNTLTPQKDALTDNQLRAIQVNVATTKEQEYIHFPFSVSAVGAPATYTMADPAKKLRLRDIVALDDTSNPTGAVISVKIGALEVHRGYAISKTQRKTGNNAGDTLTISISKNAAVAGTAILEEV